jgi:hypothetical protein
MEKKIILKLFGQHIKSALEVLSRTPDLSSLMLLDGQVHKKWSTRSSKILMLSMQFSKGSILRLA